MNSQTRTHHQMMSLQQAANASPTLAHLSELVAQSQQRLAVILPLLPPGLRKAVRAGPLKQGEWWLLVDHTAAAAKLRQLMPAFKLALESKGLTVTAVRVKVQQASWK